MTFGEEGLPWEGRRVVRSRLATANCRTPHRALPVLQLLYYTMSACNWEPRSDSPFSLPTASSPRRISPSWAGISFPKRRGPPSPPLGLTTYPEPFTSAVQNPALSAEGSLLHELLQGWLGGIQSRVWEEICWDNSTKLLLYWGKSLPTYSQLRRKTPISL